MGRRKKAQGSLVGKSEREGRELEELDVDEWIISK
jgi:hypothetical protein